MAPRLDAASRARPAFPACPRFPGDGHHWPHGDPSLTSISAGKSQEEREEQRQAGRQPPAAPSPKRCW